jgi:hypothetical protein
MSQYLIQKETLTNLANSIRAMTGTTEALSLDQITNSTSASNEEIELQAELIAQINSALEGKAVR